MKRIVVLVPLFLALILVSGTSGEGKRLQLNLICVVPFFLHNPATTLTCDLSTPKKEISLSSLILSHFLRLCIREASLLQNINRRWLGQCHRAIENEFHSPHPPFFPLHLVMANVCTHLPCNSSSKEREGEREREREEKQGHMAKTDGYMCTIDSISRDNR